MSLPEILYGIAYITFVIGVGWCLRSSGTRGAIIMMLCGLGLDFAVTIAPSLGCNTLKMQVVGSNEMIVFGIVAGAMVWLMGFIIIGTRNRMSTGFFQNGLIAIQVLWFIDYIAFAYGMHVYPLQ